MRNKNSQDIPAEKTGADAGRRLSSLRFYSDEFVFNTVSGMFYRLTPTAGFLLHAVDGGADAEEMAARLQEKYGISEMRAVRDVELFLNDLAALGIAGLHAPQPPARKNK